MFMQFINECFTFDINAVITRSAFREAWVRYNKTSTNINKLYKWIDDSIDSRLSLDKKNIYGITLAECNTSTNNIVKIQSDTLNDYKLQKLKLMEEKLEAEKLAEHQRIKLKTEKLEAEKLAEHQRIKLETEKLEAEKLAAKEKIEAKKLATIEMTKIAEAKLLLKAELVDKKIAADERALDKKLDMERQKMAHQTLENNKNRRMFNEKSNPWFNMRIYGSPGAQYVTTKSLKQVLAGNVLVHDVINGEKEKNKSLMKDSVSKIISKINLDVDEICEPTMIINENGVNDKINAVDIQKVKETIETLVISLQNEGLTQNSKNIWKETMNGMIDTIYNISNSTHMNKMIPTHNEYIKTKSLDNIKRSKEQYLKPKNLAQYDTDNKSVIRCYCCGDSVNLASSGCHRGHNIPFSKEGNWHKDNIYLCCATCNQNMGNSCTLEEYSISMLLNVYGEILNNIKEV